MHQSWKDVIDKIDVILSKLTDTNLNDLDAAIKRNDYYEIKEMVARLKETGNALSALGDGLEKYSKGIEEAKKNPQETALIAAFAEYFKKKEGK